MTEWKEYTGSDEQIAEMENAKNGFICKNDYGYIWDDVYIDWSKCPIGATHYLICKPHPLVDMICQQARTGQPVWVRVKKYEAFSPTDYDTYWWTNTHSVVITTTPNWNIPNAEYSFTEFKKEV